MKVVAFNGSPRKEGNTFQAIKIVAEQLEKENIEVEIIHVGNKKIQGCTACNTCFKTRNEKCIIDDEVNEWIQKMKQADGIIFGSPVHFSSIGATMKAFMDRAMYVGSANNSLFRHKVGASVIAVRRAGGIPAFEQLNKYINYSEMLMPSSNYWNVIYGQKPGEALEDAEGVQIMKLLGKNMAWLMKLIELGEGKIEKPEQERKIYTNFIR
ncbi:MAG: flavodoxin family protein [Sedimentibacter sp.]|uniref:flavodoxin family protein n=1 Tax=Sedimentibacter sp. TaxID=1960295 RepID=UPI002980C09F|nr:flavodoxin family protein [Sedimentibacter sp.]MDW5299255.1 flavodoxin family protein [Sedimentibacter sp.]